MCLRLWPNATRRSRKSCVVSRIWLSPALGHNSAIPPWQKTPHRTRSWSLGNVFHSFARRRRFPAGFAGWCSRSVIADAAPETVTARALAKTQRMPLPFLYSILVELRNAGFLQPRRGKNPGYTLTKPR